MKSMSLMDAFGLPPHRRFAAASVPLVVVCLLVMTGCQPVQPDPVAFDPNLVHTTKYAIAEDLPIEQTDQAAADAHWFVNHMFGTPDDPKLPDVLSDEGLGDLVSMDHLRLASGSADADGRGLYRQHCSKCHGVTGGGRGPIAAVQTPYPRDYRRGTFKFKHTPLGTKPTKSDIARLLKHGIGGTAMNPIPELSDTDIDALVDYVIYLSIRGEVERTIVDLAMFDGIVQDGGRVIDSDLGPRVINDASYAERMETLADSDDELTEAQEAELESFENYQESWEYAVETTLDIAGSWADAQEEAIDAPERPDGLPIAENASDVVRLRQGALASVFNESVHRGQVLYQGTLAGCVKCHGKSGEGDGQTNDYDVWTKEWTVNIKLDPKQREALIPMLARGAMQPQTIHPRNFTEGLFRGGKSSDELYRRITQGVDGTPMPAATFVDGKFEETDVWHLINYIRSLEERVEDEPVANPAVDQVAKS